MDKVRSKVKILIIILLVASCMISYYFYLSRSISLNNIIGIESIQYIDIITDVSPIFKEKLPKEIKVDKKQDIDLIMQILNKYKYSKIVKYYNQSYVSANHTNAGIHMFLNFSNIKNIIKEQYIFVDSENDVAIRNKNDINIEYKVAENGKKLFEDLVSWLKQK
jgi:hypothetical protein